MSNNHEVDHINSLMDFAEESQTAQPNGTEPQNIELTLDRIKKNLDSALCDGEFLDQFQNLEGLKSNLPEIFFKLMI